MIKLLAEYKGTIQEFEADLLKWYGITFSQLPYEVQKLYTTLNN